MISWWGLYCCRWYCNAVWQNEEGSWCTAHICQGHYERYPNKKIAIFFRSITINCIYLLSVIFRQTVWGGEAGSMAKIFSSAKDMNDNPEQESWPKIWTTRHERARADPTWPYHQTIVHGLYILYISSFLYISYISYLYISSFFTYRTYLTFTYGRGLTYTVAFVRPTVYCHASGLSLLGKLNGNMRHENCL